VEKQEEGIETIYCMVDMHAITVWQDPEKLRQQTREGAAAFIAAGIDPARSILFNQSQVAAHVELGWIFNCIARMGWMSRMTQFKDKAGKNSENVSLGLFAYPSLMAADILAYKATHVPVGDDQKQHLELCRDIAIKFNNDYGVNFFPIVEPVIEGAATRVMSLRDGTKKMSKSDPSDQSRINLTDDADTISKKIRKAKTDPEPLPETLDGLKDRPEARNLVNIYAALSGHTAEQVIARLCGRAVRHLQTGAGRSGGGETRTHHAGNEPPDAGPRPRLTVSLAQAQTAPMPSPGLFWIRSMTSWA
jgi:tryptophanyl-tRNA synthetase